ncbi:MAG: hypothetical protein ABH877_01680 [bacterium]
MDATTVVEMTELEYREIVKEVRGCVERMRATMRLECEKIAEQVARLDVSRLAQAKKELKSLLKPDWLERLWLFGRGQISWHWAKDEHTLLPISYLRLRPVQQLLFDTEREVTIYQHRKNPPMIRKKLWALSGYELAQVVDLERPAFRDEKQQRDWMRAHETTPEKSAKDPTEFMEFDGLSLSVDGKSYFLWGRFSEDDPGTRRAAIRVPADVLRSTLK